MKKDVLEVKFCSHFEEIPLFSLVSRPYSLVSKIIPDELQMIHLVGMLIKLRI